VDEERRGGRSDEGPAGQILVVADDHGLPFSKGLLAQSLTATGLPPDRAYQVAREVELHVLGERRTCVEVEDLHALVGRVLRATQGERFYHRYAKWQRLARQDRPVIILIGGATGVGKSTLATQLAHRLGVVRIISTDTVREVMRSFFSATLMPAIHFSSFNAGGAVRVPIAADLDPHIIGFAEQAQTVTTGLTAVIDRAINEGTSMVLEGVHIVPGYLSPARWGEALVLPMVVIVRSTELHRSHFLVRDRETNGSRPVQRYLGNFEAIRRIQDFVLGRALAEGTLVIENLNIDDTVGLVVDALYDLIEAMEESVGMETSGGTAQVGDAAT
jgi:2-phosphoglycerate kinase